MRFIRTTLDCVIDIETANERDFDEQFKPIPNYPAAKAAANFVQFIRKLGATDKVLDELSKLIDIPQQTRSEIMATAKKRVVPAPPEKPERQPKAEKPAKKEKPTKPAKPAKAGSTTKKEAGKPSAAQRFRELIMAGKLTDDQIFATVKEEYGLDDSKRGYVKWYRNDLMKAGKNPPAAKE